MNSDLRWYLDNGGRDALRRVGFDLASLGCGAGTESVTGASKNPSPERPRTRLEAEEGAGRRLEPPEGTPPQIAPERKTRSTLRVTFYRNRQGHVVGFEVSGHANFGTPGQDIVCAAVSALAQAALLGLEEFADHSLTSSVTKGHLVARLDLERTTGEVYGIIRMLELGFAAIERSYPGWLTVTYEEARK